MVATRSRAGAVNMEIPKSKPPPVSVAKDDGYERCRDQRIKENLQRMQQLGLTDLASKLKSENQLSRSKRTFVKRVPMSVQSDPRERYSSPRRSCRLCPPPSPRRSRRLQSAIPICYDESDGSRRVKKSRSGKGNMNIIEMVSKDEIYTEEHEKLLGSCEANWTLFVDGCGPDGRRIYDQVKGKTCHQCRQKTLGYHTQCSNCEIVQGQFCGDCLYMRYGENVLEANKNPDWICPVCRGICNCSICRGKKNWPPTGSLYRKIFKLGYKSVAHYLIKTRQVKAISEELASESPIKANKELSLTTVKSPPTQSSVENSVGNHLLQLKDCLTEDDSNKIVNIDGSLECRDGSSDSVICMNTDGNEEQNTLPETESFPHQSSPQVTHEKQLGPTKGKKPKSSYVNFIPSPDSIAGRLRKRQQNQL